MDNPTGPKETFDEILEELRSLDPELANLVEAGAGAEITLPYLLENHPLYSEEDTEDTDNG